MSVSSFPAPGPVQTPDFSSWRQPINGTPDPIEVLVSESEKSGKGSDNLMQDMHNFQKEVANPTNVRYAYRSSLLLKTFHLLGR